MSNEKIDRLKTLIEKDPKNPLGRYGLANEYYKASMYEEAIVEIKEYLNVKEDEGAVYRMLAECYIKTGNTEAAKNSYTAGIEAANKHGHPSMAEELGDYLEFLDE